MACKIPYATVEAMMASVSAKEVFSPAIPNTTRWVGSGLRSYYTGPFRGKPYRRALQSVLGATRTLSDVQVPLEIPVLHVEAGRVVSYVGSPGHSTGGVHLASLARASSAISGIFEAESLLDPGFPEDHFVDPGLTEPIGSTLAETLRGQYDRILVLVSDLTRTPSTPNLRGVDWSYFKLLYQALASVYTENMRRAALSVQKHFGKTSRVQIMRTPTGVDFWSFTGADLVRTAHATRDKALTFLDNPGLSDQV